jgi:hypothetical protein
MPNLAKEIGKQGVQTGLKAITKAAAQGGSIEDMANAAGKSLPSDKASKLGKAGKKAAADSEKEVEGTSPFLIAGLIGGGLLAVGTTVYLVTR